MTWLNIYTSSYHHRIIIIKSEIWIIAQCLGLGHEIMVCAVCLTMLLWKHFLTSGPLCWESTRDQYSLQREPLLQGFDVVFPVCLIKPLDKQSSEQWNEIPEHSCYIPVMMNKYIPWNMYRFWCVLFSWLYHQLYHQMACDIYHVWGRALKTHLKFS